MITENVMIQIIIAVAAVATTYLTVKYKDRVIKKRANKPVDRMENIFDGYEKLIARQELTIISLGKTVDRLEKELENTRTDLAEQKNLNNDLKQQLRELRKAYGIPK